MYKTSTLHAGSAPMTLSLMEDPRYTVTYGNEDLDLYVATNSRSKPLIVYVHGGAWRSENKEQHRDLAIRLRDLTDCPVAVVDYRLTNGQELKHPSHAKDVLDALRFLLAWPDGPPFDPTRIYLIGHSAGAHILTSIFLDSAASFTPLPADNTPLKPDDKLLDAVQGIAIASGIYDLEMLLRRFPSYEKRFIRPAFRDPLGSWNTTHYPLHAKAHAIQWHVIHSTGDTLVDQPQSEAIFDHLETLYKEKGWSQDNVTKDWDTLIADHHYVKDLPFAQLIADWVKRAMAS